MMRGSEVALLVTDEQRFLDLQGAQSSVLAVGSHCRGAETAEDEGQRRQAEEDADDKTPA